MTNDTVGFVPLAAASATLSVNGQLLPSASAPSEPASVVASVP